jgi:hypothetical protein
MKYLRWTARHTLIDHERNEDILEELHVTSLQEELWTYRHNWLQHVRGLEDCWLPKQLLNHHPKGRRRPLKRLQDDVNAKPATGQPGLIHDGTWWRRNNARKVGGLVPSTTSVSSNTHLNAKIPLHIANCNPGLTIQPPTRINVIHPCRHPPTLRAWRDGGFASHLPLLGHRRCVLPRIPTDDRSPQDLGDLGAQTELYAGVSNVNKIRITSVGNWNRMRDEIVQPTKWPIADLAVIVRIPVKARIFFLPT